MIKEFRDLDKLG
jgi:hypothetical protein